ncbi:uncharacterized protein TNCV_4143761 [Trichonephila clavipes]|nr:uncharacterized protein TNCV_4143761 [Trichonephila clavipes]
MNFITERRVIHQVKIDPKISAPKIAASTSNTLGRSVSAETVRRVLRKAGYNGRVARKKPLIVGCVIDLLTGFVIDYEVMSKRCGECEQTKFALEEDRAEFRIWYEGHQDVCSATHVRSSGAMEIGQRTNRLTNTFTKGFCVRITNTFKKDLCLDNEHIFGGDQRGTPEIMDEILTTARDLELEVNEDDIEELIMGHEDELTIEELQEILNEEHQET